MGMHIVVTGNPINGHCFFGPFKTEQDAIDWAVREDIDDWWIAKLEAPN